MERLQTDRLLRVFSNNFPVFHGRATFLRSQRILTLGNREEVPELAEGRLGGRRLKTVNLTQH